MKHDLKVYLRLLSYLKPYWGVAILVVIGFAINAATEVSVAKLLEKIIEAIQHRDQGFTTLFPLLVVCGNVLPWVGFVHGRLLYCGRFRNLVFNIRQEVFAKLLRLPSQYYLDNNSGHITAKIMYQRGAAYSCIVQSHSRTIVQQGLITHCITGLPDI